MKSAADRTDMTMLTLVGQLQDEGYCLLPAQVTAFQDTVREACALAEALVDNNENIDKKWRHLSGKVKHLVNAHRHHVVFRHLMHAPHFQAFLHDVFGNCSRVRPERPQAAALRLPAVLRLPERQRRAGVHLLRQPFHSGVWTHALCAQIAFRVLWHSKFTGALCVPVRAGPRAIQN